jgi:hypothetical protein
MNNVFKTLGSLVGSIAPTLATMLGGPLAGTAVSALASAFGLTGQSTADDITKVIQTGGMTPEIIAAVRAADQKHQEIMGQQGIDLAKLNADHDAVFVTADTADRASARQMQIAVPSIVPEVLSVGITLGFFGVLGMMMGGVDPTDNNAFLIMLGALAAAMTQVLNYWFGSTRQSANNQNALAQIAKAS